MLIGTLQLCRYGRLIRLRRAPVFSRLLPDGVPRILIAGDSAACGAGARQQDETIAGRFGRIFPAASIFNTGTGGIGIRRLRRQLSRLRERLDLIVIFIGGNDVLSFLPLAGLERPLVAAIHAAQRWSVHVALVFPGDASAAPILPVWLKCIISRRVRTLHALFRRAAAQTGILLVDTLQFPSAQRYFAEDGLHPNANGYDAYFRAIVAELQRRDAWNSLIRKHKESIPVTS